MSENNPKLLSMFGQAASIFAVALPRAIETHPNIIALSADTSTPAGLDKFKAAHPENFYNLGIAEQNMIGVAAGLSSEGYLPVCTAQACFLSMRDFEQIRQYCGYMQKRMILVGLFSGFSLSFLGKTHFALEDIALMRTIPGMVVMCPADDTEARLAMKAAVEHDGPVYIRFGRAPVPVVFGDDYKFEIGKGSVIREGKDVSIVANGLCVASALEAADMLAKDGIDAEVVNICTIKPLDEDLIVKTAKKTGKVVTAEEHNIIGGLGGAVAECLAEKCPTKMYRIGMRDQFGESGSAGELLHKYMLDGEGIYKQVKAFVK